MLSLACAVCYMYMSRLVVNVCVPQQTNTQDKFFSPSLCVFCLLLAGIYYTKNVTRVKEEKGKKKEGEISWGDSLCTHQTIRAEQVDYHQCITVDGKVQDG